MKAEPEPDELEALRLGRLRAPGESEPFEQPADSGGLLLDGGKPGLESIDSSTESKHEAGKRAPSGEDGDEFR